MSPDDPELRAAELATQIVSARVGAAAGRPNAAEGQDLAGYFRIVLRETRRSLGLPPVAEAEPPRP
jgi:hypothetical protein